MIDFDAFTEWAESRFGNIKINGDDIRANSVFHPTKSDTKYRLWMKPSGTTRKGDRADGVYHCFDTNQKGTLLGLVMEVDKCTYAEACDKIGGGGNLAKLEKRIKDFFDNKYKTTSLEEELEAPIFQLPSGSVPMSYKSTDYAVIQACLWLDKRKLSPEGLFFCLDDKRCRGRIIIPYYDKDGTLIYYNARTLGKGTKYIGPPKDTGVGKDDVIYFSVWPAEGSKVYLVEGEFDARTLVSCGFYAAAVGGKNLSDKQMDFLKGYRICLALDNDSAGKSALLKMYSRFRSRGTELSYVSPPKNEKIKDWNDLYIASDDQVVKAYVGRHEKSFDERDFLDMSLDFLAR